jgi:predicted nucleic acid-binding protein
MYLLDTNVLSELRKAKTGKINKAVETWAGHVPVSSLYLSVITILEVELGVLLKERSDIRQGNMLRVWLNDHVMPSFRGRILEINTLIALRCASLHVPDPKSYRDSLIAATALVHKLTIVTRNVSDFIRTGVNIINPWDYDHKE